ncbi:hypothetical protein P7F60_28785 [Rhizobium sp. YJ-22]|nr:hypothetical protein [Rhizobium sp. YJ-22]MDG3580379.1 hypothetical protein [Rhizobium sp. YJ-22]
MTKKHSEIDIILFPPARQRAAYTAEGLLIAVTAIAGIVAVVIAVAGLGR